MRQYKNLPNIILFPLLIWFSVSFVQALEDPIGNIPTFFFSEINMLLGILFAILVNYYVVNEIKFYSNYVKISDKKVKLISNCVNFISFITIFLLIISIMRLYINKFVVI